VGVDLQVDASLPYLFFNTFRALSRYTFRRIPSGRPKP
jgi:hypothetical protein